MKITVAILNKNTKAIQSFISRVIYISFVCFLVFAVCFFAKYIYVSPKVLNLATNLRQADEKNVNANDLLAFSYPIFNAKNYVLTDESQKNQEDLKRQKAENKPIETDQDKIEIIDSLVDDDTRQSVQAMSKNEAKNVTVKDSENMQRINIYNVEILNYSSNRNIDVSNLSDRIITLTKASDSILLYNTHTSESYSNSDKYKFEYDGVYRSRNSNFNMLKITDQFQKNLSEKNFKVKHDTTPHDYGTYNSSYSRSRITVKNDLKTIGNVGLSIDVHRDAAGDLTYGPTADIKGVKVAQCMIVLGLGNDTIKNPYWQENLSLAITLQRIGNTYYPGLFKAMILRNSVYNQDLNKFSILIEIGATGNTIDQALLSTRCLTNVLNILYKN